jgi:arylsulfatase A-like enzyme
MLTVAGACAIAAASWVSEVNYNTIYPTLHLSSFLVTFTTLSFAISTAISALAPRWLQRPRYLRAVFIVGAGLLMLGLCSSVLLATRADRRVLSSHTSLGQIELIRGEIRQPRAHGNVRADACRKTPEFSQAAAMGIFRRHAGLPVFAPDFDPLRFNIVLLMAEAVRFDETGFVKDSATPNIVELAKRGALVASRAYAPSTSTLLTLSSLLSMTFTSHTAVTTMVPPWRSRLREEAATVPELLQSAGYSTFAVLHGFRPEGALQGLADVERVSNKVRPHSRIDRDIASRMIDALASRRHSESKFFGWMFLVAPHLPYVEMFERSDASARDRYRASIAHADAQIGRVLRYLHHSGLLDETIVIVTSDHGEEFREHGNIGHGVNLYEVSSHVPLLIRIPGQSLSETASPTSLTYVFPWLLSYTGGAIGSSARDVIQRDLAPVMAATDGSVIIENISSRADLVALVRGDYLLHHNVLSERTELFDLNNDPTEVVRRAGDVLKDEYRHRLRQYLDVRRCHARIVVTREKLRGADLEASPSDHEPYRQKTAEPPREWKTTAGQP